MFVMAEKKEYVAAVPYAEIKQELCPNVQILVDKTLAWCPLCGRMFQVPAGEPVSLEAQDGKIYLRVCDSCKKIAKELAEKQKAGGE